MNELALKHEDDVERLIAEHNGDVHTAVAVLLSERSFLIRELEYDSMAMGYGFARGWRRSSHRRLDHDEESRRTGCRTD